MSWSVTGIEAPADDHAIEAAIDTAIANAGSQVEGSDAQIAAARTAALALAAAVARPEDGVRISMSGHSNPDRAPRPGWADQMVSVTVSQVPAKAEG